MNGRVLAALAVVIAASQIVFAAEADVPSLTKDTFADTIKGDLTLVKFFAPWCGHCKSMKTDYEDAAAALKGKAVLAEVDATVEKDLASEYGVKGFPTIKLFAKGEELSEYKGGRDKQSFIKYIERAMLPSIDDLSDADAVKKYEKEHSDKAIFVSSSLDKLSKSFKKLSMSMRDSLPDGVTFASVSDVDHVNDASRGSTLGAKDSVLVIRDDGTADVFNGEDGDGLETFVLLNSIPALGELSRSNAQVYTELGVPVFILFQDPKKKDETVMGDIETISKNVRSKGKLAFTWVDGVELKSFMEHLGVADQDPAVAIYDFDSDARFTLEEDYSKDAVTKFVDDFMEGKLVQAKKSEPIPEKNDEPVKVVVGDSWEEIVEDESKDVLIEQYAPWCGHCKQLAPVLETVAKALKDAGVETLVLAKMDATANDPPAGYKAKGFPTMHFFPAGKKDGIEYDGGRKKEDFIAFFKKHATHSFKEPEFPAESGEDASGSEDKTEEAEDDEDEDGDGGHDEEDKDEL